MRSTADKDVAGVVGSEEDDAVVKSSSNHQSDSNHCSSPFNDIRILECHLIDVSVC